MKKKIRQAYIKGNKVGKIQGMIDITMFAIVIKFFTWFAIDVLEKYFM